MAHGITGTDHMFTVREPSWHQLEGAVFEDYPTREEAQEQAHPWEPITEPVYRKVPVILENGELSEQYEEIETHKAVVRSDTGETLGVNNATYEPIKNEEMYDIAEALEGESKGDVMYETGGSLDGGKKVWLLIRFKDPLDLGGDARGTSVPYFALQNSHDGSGAFRGQATMVRIVCANTAKLSDMFAQAKGTEFSFHHTKNVRDRIDEARIALAGWRHSVEEYSQFMAILNDTYVDTGDQLAFIERFIPAPPPNVASDRVMTNIENARAQFLGILHGPTCESVDTRAAGLLHASIEYAEWGRRAHSQESRFKRAYLNKNDIVATATELVRELVNV